MAIFLINSNQHRLLHLFIQILHLIIIIIFMVASIIDHHQYFTPLTIINLWHFSSWILYCFIKYYFN